MSRHDTTASQSQAQPTRLQADPTAIRAWRQFVAVLDAEPHAAQRDAIIWLSDRYLGHSVQTDRYR